MPEEKLRPTKRQRGEDVVESENDDVVGSSDLAGAYTAALVAGAVSMNEEATATTGDGVVGGEAPSDGDATAAAPPPSPPRSDTQSVAPQPPPLADFELPEIPTTGPHCIKIDPRLHPRFEGDDKAHLPDFRSFVNYPQCRYLGDCVMCGGSESPVPSQNKGICKSCDSSVWIVRLTGMQVKWCKGCKNFRKWVDFGVKTLSTKCQQCRAQQAERYAKQKRVMEENRKALATVQAADEASK